MFDIPLIQYTANKDGDAEKQRQFTLQVGTLSSALEHITPEQMFAPTDPNAPRPDAISAVKALQKASAAGQKIYQINQANMGQILPLLGHDQTTLNEIRTALNAGKDVTTHTSAVSIPGGWSGFGYIITDPIVGDGVYKISGRLNGGFMALGKLISLLDLILNYADGLTGTFGKAIPLLGSIARLMTVARVTYDLLNAGGKCKGDAGGVIFVMAMFTIVSLLMIMLLTLMVNPLVGFAGGLAIDYATGLLLSESRDCKG